MPEEVKPNAAQAPTHDAQLAAENIMSGEEETPTVDFDGDYEAAKKLSVSDIDRSDEGRKAAEEATAPNYQISQPEETTINAQSTSNPDDYLEMAQEVGAKDEAVTNVSDDLVEKALQKGQAKS